MNIMIQNSFEYCDEIKDYIIQNHIDNVIIYGLGYSGKFLYNILKNDVNILGFIDNYKDENKFQNKIIYKDFQIKDLKVTDNIIITVMDSYQIDKIKSSISSQSNNIKIYVLSEIYGLIKKRKIRLNIKHKRQNMESIKLIIGSSATRQKGWIPTDIDNLDITNENDFKQYFDSDNSIDALLCEYVKPNGFGWGSDDHKCLYTYLSLKSVFEKKGFKVKLLEYFDEKGRFHKNSYKNDDGHIYRSMENDSRNFDGKLKYTSVIIDAVKIATSST